MGEYVPEPEERDAPPERREEEDAMTYPGHDDPDVVRDRVGLPDEGRPEPSGAPPPQEPETGTPTPSDERS